MTSIQTFLAIIATATALVVLSSCTEQSRVREFGGEMTINLPKGEKLLMATWKDDNIFYLTEPMEENYTPKNKTFRESSSYGIMESTIIFVESR